MEIQEQKIAENWSDVKQIMKESESEMGRATAWAILLIGMTFGVVIYVVSMLMSLPKQLLGWIKGK